MLRGTHEGQRPGFHGFSLDVHAVFMGFHGFLGVDGDFSVRFKARTATFCCAQAAEMPQGNSRAAGPMPTCSLPSSLEPSWPMRRAFLGAMAYWHHAICHSKPFPNPCFHLLERPLLLIIEYLRGSKLERYTCIIVLTYQTYPQHNSNSTRPRRIGSTIRPGSIS